MWRVQGFVGRVLHRYHGSSTLRLPQSHHVEDEVINTSAALSTSRQSSDNSSQREDDGERRKQQRTFQFGHANDFPRYTALDAVGWGAVAVLFMQICRRIHSRFSSGSEPSPTPGTLTAPSSLQKSGCHILLDILSRRDVLPRGRSALCLQAGPESRKQDQFCAQSSSSSSSEQRLAADSSLSDHQGELLSHDSLTPEEILQFESWSQQSKASQDNPEKNDAEDVLSDKGRLEEAALNLRQVGNTSVPVILNIIGLESVKSEKYEEAFTCFLAAAQQGYNKAQFNTGVCYEKGRGVGKDKEKALQYYRQAAAGGHKQAQYRCAKLLLASRGHQSVEELTPAISLLEEAAAAGLTKAQLCLASVYSRDTERYGCKSIQYLKMAAGSGDDTALLFLAQCYETGFGVPQNLKAAGELYKQAAQAGNKQAKSLLSKAPFTAEDAVMRSIRSAPCFSVPDSLLQKPLSSLASRHAATLSLLPHSWSTGNLCAAPSALSSTPLHLYPPCTEIRACQWTVGVG